MIIFHDNVHTFWTRTHKLLVDRISILKSKNKLILICILYNPVNRTNNKVTTIPAYLFLEPPVALFFINALIGEVCD